MITIIQLFTSSFAAYGFSKNEFLEEEIHFLLRTSQQLLFLGNRYMIPQFIMMRQLGLTDVMVTCFITSI